MIIFNDLAQVEKPLKNPVLTIGNFDGVHRGHLALFDKVKNIAKRIDGTSVVMTFNPHPIKVVKPGNGPLLITSFEQKVSLIADAGLDVLIAIPFNMEFAALSAVDFIKTILVERIGVKEIVVGYDYSFGKGRSGNIDLLSNMGKDLGYNINVVDPVHLNNTLVSSTSIRNLLKDGDLSDAKRLLGRDYCISGTVKKGKGRGGSILGFPTANIIPEDELIPKHGVYAVKVYVDNKKYSGVCNIGNNPTFGGTGLTVETHILDFSGDLLGKEITILFVLRLRGEETYSSVEELKKEITRDIEKAKKLLALHEKY